MADLPLLQIQKGLILGIDLGSRSLGTALVNPESQEIPFLGVRIFPAGVVGDIEEGREASRSAQRRDARLARRQTQRRQRRLYKVFHLLQRIGLLPAGPRVEVLYKLQRELERRYPETTVVPYFLRARALGQALDAHELGRALYHLAQRRGFKSNRKGDREDPKKRSEIKEAITELEAQIKMSGKQTLGAYMAALNTHEVPIRNKLEFNQHYTHRRMYEYEFERIWETQQAYFPGILTPDRKAKLHHAIFHQRPLKDQSHLIGHCELEPDATRAPLYLLEAQRFRVLGFVNNLRIERDDGRLMELSPKQRAELIHLTEIRADLPFETVKPKLGLPEGARFTVEKGGEKKVPVNLTATKFRAVLRGRWDALSPDAMSELVKAFSEDSEFDTDEQLEEWLSRKWQFDAETVGKLIKRVHLPKGHSRFSEQAIRRLLPELEREQGANVENAIRTCYPERRTTAVPEDLLPPVKCDRVKRLIGEIRNPAVLRALTELRKTVNAIVRRYGKPESICVELARDLKKSKKQRERAVLLNREQEERRERAKEALRQYNEGKFQNPSRADIEKHLLAEEAIWHCPYSGLRYNMTDVFGDPPQVEVEHILPRSRYPDNSFSNKTLVYSFANRDKGDRTPYEWLHDASPAQYERMLRIVAGFRSPDSGGKKRRFSMDQTEFGELYNDFMARQLEETRYASKLACRYLGLLYGGEVDAAGKRRVFATAGQVTSELRYAYGLHKSETLNPSHKPEKSRSDHRHHAMDALTIAMTNQASIEAYAAAAWKADREHSRTVKLEPPSWPSFAADAEAKIKSTKVSYRPRRKLSGKLHDDTLYSKQKTYSVPDANGVMQPARKYVHYRKPITKVKTEADIRKIVDERVRQSVLKKFEDIGGGGDKFKDNWPLMLTKEGIPSRTKDGREVPIKRVRIRNPDAVMRIGNMGGDSIATRVPITSIRSKADIDKIVNASARSWVTEKFTALGGGGNLFRENPVIPPSRTGEARPLRYVWVHRTRAERDHNLPERVVSSSDNHHALIVAMLDVNQNPKAFECTPVPLIEAMERKLQGLPVVDKNTGPGRRLICTLSKGDLVEVHREPGAPATIWLVESVRESQQLVLSLATDARPSSKKEGRDVKEIWQPMVNTLFGRVHQARKVVVTHLGDVISAND